MMMMMYEEEEILQNAWSSELLPDLLGLISEKLLSLSLSEYIKFGSVCVGWRSFSIQNYQHIKLSSKLPILLIPIPTSIANKKYIPSPLSSIEAAAEDAEDGEEAEDAVAAVIEDDVRREVAEVEEEKGEEGKDDELEDEMEDETTEDDEMEEEMELPQYYDPRDIWKGQNNEQRYRSTRNLYSIYEKKVYHDFRLPVPYYKNIRGSSNGWLVTVEECCSDQGVDYYPVRLFNPFRTDNNEIQLPPLTLDPTRTSYYLHKAILSANPSSLSDPTTQLVVLGICTRSLAFCRPGDKYWTHLEGAYEYRSIMDAICYQGKFYGILQSGYVFAFDTDLFHHHPTLTVLEGLLPPEDSHYPLNGQLKRYLVECEGELLQVRRDICTTRPPIRYVTTQFLVFKRDPMDPTKWVETKTLNDRMLFLGSSSTSMSLSALEFPGCKPNSIYYTDDLESLYFAEPCSGPHDIGVFSIEDRSFESHHGLESMIMPAPIWIQPML